jgi:folate-binding protein YgfZ
MHPIANQYRIIESGAGWADRRARGRIRLDGADARAFLHALVSNDVQSLARGGGVYAAWLTPQGRMIGDLRIHDRGDHWLVEVPSGRGADLAARLDQLIFTEDVRVSDVTASTAVVRVTGARAADTVARWLGVDAGTLAALPPLAQLDVPSPASGHPVADFAACADDGDAPAFDVWMPAGAYPGALDALRALDVPELDGATVDALRVMAARPEFGVDMTEETIPLEAGLLDRAISTTKGCYVGQEVIIRVLHRGGGRVAKRLVQVAFDADPGSLPRPGAPLAVDGQEAGRVTSVAWSPRQGRGIALGYVPREAADSRAPVEVVWSGGRRPAAIVRLAG